MRTILLCVAAALALLSWGVAPANVMLTITIALGALVVVVLVAAAAAIVRFVPEVE